MGIRRLLLCVVVASAAACGGSNTEEGGDGDAGVSFGEVTSGVDTSEGQDATLPAGDMSPDPSDVVDPTGDDASPDPSDVVAGDATSDVVGPTGDDASPDPSDVDGQGACVPETCASLAASCGMVPDGCGAEMNCGACAENESCTDDWECECEP
ncbi:MAG: hypothetical protein QF464_23030, partial [Myxococcota bacterium]|nr:hypothetical protein [Myxococcota bacterium]